MNDVTDLINACGCCTGLAVHTPIAVANQQGLSALAYRVGTHAQFKQSMLARLGADGRNRGGLRTQDNEDFSIALLDAWATVADVLTFYQERIANESYRRTATDHPSLLELARLVGYEPRPGVAASTYLAFTLEEAAGAPGWATLPVGTKVQSVPGPDEQPQTFETVEKLEARAAWNELRPQQTQVRWPQTGDERIFLRGVISNLRAGDLLLFVGRTRERREGVGTDRWQLRRITTIELDATADRALVRWHKPLGEELPATEQARVYVLRLRTALFGHNAMPWGALPIGLRVGERHPDPQSTKAVLSGLYANRQQEWVEKSFAAETQNINLDAVYNQVAPCGWLVLAGPPVSNRSVPLELFNIEEVREENKADYNLTAKTTRVRISGGDITKFSPRETTVFTLSEELSLAEMPLPEPVQQGAITLDRIVADVETGRNLLVRGKRARVRIDVAASMKLQDTGVQEVSLAPGDVLVVVAPPKAIPERPGQEVWHLQDRTGAAGFMIASANQVTFVASTAADEQVSELAVLKETILQTDRTRIQLTQVLQNVYDRSTVTILANVALATHGETVTEILGSGDATQPYQRFTLREAPLTYTSANTPRGGTSTLEVRVNDLKWEEVASLHSRMPHERVYVTRQTEDGQTMVQFGDGQMGARPPTGRENIQAVYRKGTGLEGLVRSGQLSLLLTRPLGVKAVINPFAATGAADPESMRDIRRNVPLTVRALDRVVSLQDYEDFVYAFAGIAKVSASWIWDGQRRSIFLTVAGPNGAPVEENTPLWANLVSSLRGAGDPDVPFRVKTHHAAFFRIAAGVKVLPAYRPEQVVNAVRQALRSHFGFEARAFGQAVALSEILAVMQAIPGVAAVDVDKLERIDGVGGDGLKQPLPAATPRASTAAAVLAAELLTLDPISLADVREAP